MITREQVEAEVRREFAGLDDAHLVVEVVMDPVVDGAAAVRCTWPGEEPLTLLRHADGALEYVVFTEWPPVLAPPSGRRNPGCGRGAS